MKAGAHGFGGALEAYPLVAVTQARIYILARAGHRGVHHKKVAAVLRPERVLLCLQAQREAEEQYETQVFQVRKDNKLAL